MVGHMMMVWLRTMLGRCAWRRSRGATTKGFATDKISNVRFLFYKGGGGDVGMRFLILYLEGKHETIRYTMYLGRHSIYLRIGFDG
jgi:hypothetical protein